jgi:hypothetical protein
LKREASERFMNDQTLPLLLFCTDLMFTVQLQNMARKAGLRPLVVKPGAPLPPGDMLVVDLSSRADWEQPIREARERGTTVLAFGPHMDAAGRKRAKEAGAQRVLANSNLQRDLPGILLAFRQREETPLQQSPEHGEAHAPNAEQ